MENKWPLQSECMAFYGDPRYVEWYGQNIVGVPCPWQLKVGDTFTDHIHCHKKVAESLQRVLGHVWIACDRDVAKIKKHHCDIYDGCYCLRPKRNGSSLSMHAFACALDFDAGNNGMGQRKHFFTSDGPLVTCFEEEQWIWGGRWQSPDAMHFQASRVR